MIKEETRWSIVHEGAFLTTVILMRLGKIIAVPVAARSKAWVCGRSPAEIVGSNAAGAWMSVVSVVCCQVDVSATS